HRSRAARAILREGRRPLQDLEGITRVRRARRAERARATAVLAARSDLLPQSADLSRARGAAAGDLGLSVCAEEWRVAVPRQFRDDRRVECRIRIGLEEVADLSPHRSS